MVPPARDGRAALRLMIDRRWAVGRSQGYIPVAKRASSLTDDNPGLHTDEGWGQIGIPRMDSCMKISNAGACPPAYRVFCTSIHTSSTTRGLLVLFSQASPGLPTPSYALLSSASVVSHTRPAAHEPPPCAADCSHTMHQVRRGQEIDSHSLSPARLFRR